MFKRIILYFFIVVLATQSVTFAEEKRYLNRNIETVKVNLGTLYVGGDKVINPKRPFDGGDIPSYSSLGLGDTIEIRDTDVDPEYQIKWNYAYLDGRHMLISDKLILRNISWDDLNNQGLINGKEIIIDETLFKIRLLTGGEDFRVDGDRYGGGIIGNEWDRIIVNEEGIDSLPTPNDIDLGPFTSEQKTTNHNQIWNRYGTYSWCQEIYSNNASNVIIRGYNSAMWYNNTSKTTRLNGMGWRPVLEIETDESRAFDLVVLAEKSPTINNIKNARELVNGLVESEMKEMLQNKLNHILYINDISLEIKDSTANLDVYIKSENLLGLSLSSNSISFEDFNGTEDLQEDGVLELNINSSLPYEINAYLEDEIKNADKSETMDKSILNIKESTDTDYKEFVDIKNKLNLVSHNDAGNNKLHTFDFKLNGGIAHKKDVYKATIKFEVKQK